jgi:hypothetical protein
MRCRLRVGERAVGKAQSLVDSPEHPQREGIICFRRGARTETKPIG